MKYISLVLLLAVSAYGQTKKPSTTKDAPGVSYFKVVDPCGSEAWASPVSFDESLKDGVYTARFVDICNKWRCYVTSSSQDSATIVCTKPHDVQGEKKAKP